MKQREHWDRSFPAKEICQVLLDSGIISTGQQKGILEQHAGVRRKLEAGQGRQDPESKTSVPHIPVTIVDVIASLNLKRCDDPALPLDEDLARFERFIHMPHGIVLVCGPTGSGRSTTLHTNDAPSAITRLLDLGEEEVLRVTWKQ